MAILQIIIRIVLLGASVGVAQEVIVPGTTETVPGTKQESAEPAQVSEEPKNLSELVDGLGHGDLQKAYHLLRSEYIKKEDLSDLNLNRSALQGLIDRLGFGAELLTEKSKSEQNAPYQFYSDEITEQIGYVRFGKFTNEELTQFDKLIAKYNNEGNVTTLILDLRSPQPQADFSLAANLLSRLHPPNEILFKIRRPGEERPALFQSKACDTSWSNEVVVLVDSETGNVGEIIAKVLQSKNNSILIGEKTQGLTVEFRDVTIGENRIIRYAIAEVVLEDESTVFQKGVEPNIIADANLKAKNQVFTQTDKGESLQPYVFQVERPRFNERALVAGTDPELEYRLAIMNGEKTEWNTKRPQDKVLQKAVDVLRMRDFLKSEKRKRKLR